MNLSFNYYHHLEDVDFYLCNPDGEELFPINAYDRTVALRFNDLSAVEFKVNPRIELIDGRVIDQTSCYDMLATMRLVFVSNIGWFRISSVSETDDGTERYKSVRAESLQTIFKDKGFSTVEGVYKFYDPFDPFDDNFTLGTTKDNGTPYLPSIVGQLSRQLGIGVSIGQSGQSYSGWSITYISPELEYDSGSPICRTFSEKTTYGYDFMVNDVSEAFGVVFLFDFMNKTIQIKIAVNATGNSGVCFSFNNFMKSVDVEESIEDIVTVMSCNGSGIDITSVNPTGTNYIVDFSYYMNSGEWMSGSLVGALRDWESLVSEKQPEYVDSIKSLRSLYSDKVIAESNMSGWSVWLRDLKSSQDEYIVSLTSDTEIVGIATAEAVDVGGHSLLETSSFAESSFETKTMITAYESAPVYNKDDGVWAFDGAGVYASVADHFVANRIYFTDDSSSQSYCKLEGKTVVDASSGDTQTVCTKFLRYIDYSTTSNWIVLYEQLVAESAQSVDGMEEQIQDLNDKLIEISDELNLVNYFSKTPELLRELACYWVEGDYSNENIALLDSMTTDEMIDLSYELMNAGAAELSMMSQPRYTFSLQANHVLSQYEFRNQMAELSLGRSVSVEKEDGAWYYPTLLEMSFSLDDHDTFNLVFANALRLDDWGYTYAELIAGASSTSRQVSSNWYDLTSYKREKDKLSQLIESPLDATLRASIANSVNQEFTVDNTGILGRKSIPGSPGRYEDEQLRMINNLLIFTEDGWDTAKTALGKIYWIDPETQEEHIDYGLVAETIIGSLVMSERLKIVNADSSVHIGADGIQILDSDGSVVFYASSDGSITVKSYVSAAELKAFKVTSDNIETGSITADKIDTTGLSADKISVIDEDGSIIFSANATTKEVKMSASCIDGRLVADQINTNGLSADKIHVVDEDGNQIFSADAAEKRVVMSAACIKGRLTAGQINTEGLNVDAANVSGQLSSVTLNVNNKFIVDEYGNVTLSGNVVWGTGTSPTRVVYARAALDKPENGTEWSAFDETDVNAWHTIFNKDNDYFASYTYDGGLSWTDPVKIRGNDGLNGTGATVTDQAVFDAITRNQEMFGCFVGQNGKLYINASMINTGTLSADVIDTKSITADKINTAGLSADNIHVTDTGGNTVFFADASSLPVIIGGFNVNNASLFSGKVAYQDDNDGVYIGTDGIGLGKGKFYVTKEGKLTATDIDLIGKITATDGSLSNLTLDGFLYFGGNKEYYINANHRNADYYIKLPGLIIDDGETIFDGTITAINGSIGGWSITQDGIMTDNVGLLSGSRYEYDSMVNSGTSLVKFYAGKKPLDKYTHASLTYGNNRIDVYDEYRILRYDYQASLDVPDIGYFTASVEMTNSTFALCSEVQSIEYDYDENWVYIEIKTTYTGYDNPSETAINVTFEYNFDFNIKILEDGSFYANAVDIEGNIKATSGTFSNCTIDDTCVINGSLAADVICSRSESDGAYDASAQIRYIGYSDIMNHMVVAGYQMRTDTLLGSAMIDTSCDTLGNPFAEMLVLGDNVCSSISASESGVVLESYSVVDNSYSTTLAVRATGGYLYGTWYGTSSEAIASDANAKNNISDMDDRYGVLFDHLQPKVYKYNDGTSNRLHSGFVAQEVDDALTAAGIDRSEFAAVCISNQGTATEQWSLRYDEFIALNVREIQKLKARVAELEAKLKERSI